MVFRGCTCTFQKPVYRGRIECGITGMSEVKDVANHHDRQGDRRVTTSAVCLVSNVNAVARLLEKT